MKINLQRREGSAGGDLESVLVVLEGDHTEYGKVMEREFRWVVVEEEGGRVREVVTESEGEDAAAARQST
jgi:hypothetical protein